MSRVVRATILTVLDGDEDLYRQLCHEGVLPHDEDALESDHLELARVTHTLLHELEVNWAGVEVVLRMRRELIETRRQVAELVRLLRDQERTR
jgi:hypothetical protein